MLEATGWQTREVVDAMNADSGLALTTLKVDGGMTADNLLMQFLADVLDVPVVRPMVAETVSLGAAYAAGLAVGYWPDLEGLRRNWHRAGAVAARMDPAHRGTRSTTTGSGRSSGPSAGSDESAQGWLSGCSGAARPGGDHGGGGQVESSGGDVRQVPVDLLVGGQARGHQPGADLPHGGGLQDRAGRRGDGEVRVGATSSSPASRSSRGRVRPYARSAPRRAISSRKPDRSRLARRCSGPDSSGHSSG